MRRELSSDARFLIEALKKEPLTLEQTRKEVVRMTHAQVTIRYAQLPSHVQGYVHAVADGYYIVIDPVWTLRQILEIGAHEILHVVEKDVKPEPHDPSVMLERVRASRSIDELKDLLCAHSLGYDNSWEQCLNEGAAELAESLVLAEEEGCAEAIYQWMD